MLTTLPSHTTIFVDANVADENGMTAVHKVMISDPAKSDAMLSKLIDKGAFCDFAVRERARGHTPWTGAYRCCCLCSVLLSSSQLSPPTNSCAQDNYGSRPITYCMQQVDILDSVLAKLIELRDKTGARVVDLASINTVSVRRFSRICISLALYSHSFTHKLSPHLSPTTLPPRYVCAHVHRATVCCTTPRGLATRTQPIYCSRPVSSCVHGLSVASTLCGRCCVF